MTLFHTILNCFGADVFTGEEAVALFNVFNSALSIKIDMSLLSNTFLPLAINITRVIIALVLLLLLYFWFTYCGGVIIMYMLLGCRSVYMGWAVTRASPGQFQLLEVPRYLIVNRGIIRSRSWVKFFAILIECIADVELKVKRLINFGHFP